MKQQNKKTKQEKTQKTSTFNKIQKSTSCNMCKPPLSSRAPNRIMHNEVILENLLELFKNP